MKAVPHIDSGRKHDPGHLCPNAHDIGPVIVYGVSASVVYGIIYWITTLF